MPCPRQSGSTQRRRTSPTARGDGAHPDPAEGRSGGIAAAGDQKGPVRWVEHGCGEAPLVVVEVAVASHDLGLGLRHHPLGPVVAVGLAGQHEARRNGGRGAIHTLYPFRRGRGACSRRKRPPFPVFTPVPPDIDFVALEQAELARWAAQRVFERSIEQREGAEPWVFYEGPPTANGMPGLHHAWARVYKDLFCRFRTMDGAYVARRAGWDTHGLPVEVEVEKKLGITGKEQIESQVGIAEFTRLCRESVYSYVDEFARLTTRIGYWVDMDAAYWTLDSSYIESVWWHLQQLFDQGLLYEDLKVVPYCPRCGTALSSHELGQPDVYRDEEDESAYVRFRLVDPDGVAAGWARRGRVAGRVDDDAVDAAVEHGRRREPRAGLRRRRRGRDGRRSGGRGHGGGGRRPG